MRYLRARRRKVTPAQQKMLDEASRIEARETILRCGVAAVLLHHDPDAIDRAIAVLALEEANAMQLQAEAIRDKVWNPRRKKAAN